MFRGLRLGDQFRDSQSFSARRVRKRRERLVRVRRCVREKDGRCILRGWRQRDRVRWAWVREQESAHRRDRRVRERVRERRRGDRDNAMCRVE